MAPASAIHLRAIAAGGDDAALSARPPVAMYIVALHCSVCTASLGPQGGLSQARVQLGTAALQESQSAKCRKCNVVRRQPQARVITSVGG
ncbi:hypothetical protein BT67DRAFT_444606 [Trichocladium antarcticum]|uniref:Uncharacterized protein n=1 Tax=Trichocladium antarcticum TaxID=1450529 RepID=A0AAN6UEL2_9PEZI|nr:hypothetical protein BT67DRAFT_444606 [Trichocladium antarcticum]